MEQTKLAAVRLIMQACKDAKLAGGVKIYEQEFDEDQVNYALKRYCFLERNVSYDPRVGQILNVYFYESFFDSQFLIKNLTNSKTEKITKECVFYNDKIKFQFEQITCDMGYKTKVVFKNLGNYSMLFAVENLEHEIWLTKEPKNVMY